MSCERHPFPPHPAKALMSDNSIEKIFLWFVLLSLLLHAALFAVIANLPPRKSVPAGQPYMVELRDLPAVPKKPSGGQDRVKGLEELRRRVERGRSVEPPDTPAETVRPAGRVPDRARPRKERPGGDFFKREVPKGPALGKLFPSADKLALLEEEYRKKYSPEVEEGSTQFLNTAGITLGSFLRRFESAVYGVWRYPPEAARLGIEGMVPVRITFNRKGEIEKYEVLETSGSRILDDEVRRVLQAVGTIGPLPRDYPKDTFVLIGFFSYGISRVTLH
jgi:protein TonB